MGTENSAKDAASEARMPRTERGKRTRRKLLDAAQAEFGERGFAETSISGITRRADVALGSFYTYFESKESIFRDLVRDMSEQVRVEVSKGVDPEAQSFGIEQSALAAFLRFVKANKAIYRIIDEAEFVDPESYRLHYESTAARILGRLKAGSESGEFRDDLEEAHAWAVMGMNVFLGLRYAVWDEDGEDPDRVSAIARSLLEHGLAKR